MPRDYEEPSAEYGEHSRRPRFTATPEGLKAGAKEAARRAAIKDALAAQEAQEDVEETESDPGLPE